MVPSTTLQSKILKTKKRLFNHFWEWPTITIAVFGIVVILFFSLNVVSLPGKYGIVQSELPLVSIPFPDPGFHDFEESPVQSLEKTTPVVAISTSSFYFGDLLAFSEDVLESRNKFSIPHKDGEPQLKTLIETMNTWLSRRTDHTKKKIENGGIVVFIPSGEIPMPIVIQVIAGLKYSGLFERVVLAGGLK